MNSCAVYGCPNSSTNEDPTIQYYYFPKHPLITQQWITSCWRPDPIDVGTAQICSLHFDSSCYISEYKMDYLGNYTKILKYDSVPTLYLPSSQSSNIMKCSNQVDFPISTNKIISNDIKNISLYEISNPPVPSNSVTIISSVDDSKYKHIINRQQLEEIKKTNTILKQKCEDLRMAIHEKNQQVIEEEGAIRCIKEEVIKLSKINNALQLSSLSLSDQKIILGKVFSESQIKILSGKKKIYWSNDDMAIGYTIRHLSNKRCYMYLSKNLNIPLPALSSIKRWSTLKKNEFKKDTKNDSEFVDDSE
ncbi:hypothetical protein FQA39_LY07455 [Lamprigera yunnana]|nr:hypothetical protein FQA39_LY07455 [Lamprigera yunnana]